jgi:glycerophosphoryl diester phosphodiesterase
MKRILFFITPLLVILGCHRNEEVITIGHRGGMGYETENTVAAVQKAIALGADMVEIDVFQCKSGEIVVFHDENVERLTNGAGSIEELDIIEVKSLILNDGHRVPLLQDILKAIDRKCRINIELKGANTADKVAHILHYYIEKKGWKPEDFLVSSLNETELREFHARNPIIPIGILIIEDTPLKALPLAQELKAVSIHAHYQKLTKSIIRTLHKKGFKVYAGVVNEPADIQKMKDWGVDGIFTNFPDRIK